jgi:hypothetical protein
VIPEGGLLRDKVLLPHVLVDTLIDEGVPGSGLTVTMTLLELLQHPLELFLALK